MRLPWPFGRAQRSPSGGGDAPSGGDAVLPERGPGDAWRRLPPLAEMVGPPPLVAPNRPFAAGLAANEPPAPILAPLSHGRSLDAPKGLVSGIARPAATVAAPALPEPVQRSPLGGRRGHGEEPASIAAAGLDGAEPPGTTVAPAPPSAPPSPEAAPSAAAVPAAPVRLPSARPMLTQAPEPSRIALPVGLVGQPRASGSGRSSIGSPVPAVQRSPEAASVAAAATAPGPASAAPSAPARGRVAAAPRLTIGQARRLGLGAPVLGGPVTASAPPVAGASTAGAPAGPPPGAASARAAAGPSSPGGAPGIQRSPEVDASDMPLARGATATPADATSEAPGAAGSAIAEDLAAAASGPVAARPLAAGMQRAPMLAAAPIVSTQPLRSRVQRAPLTLPQRSPDRPEASSGAAASTATAAGGPVKIHRDGEAGQLSAALDARSFTHGGEIFLPARHGPLTSGTGKALLAHELTHVGQQRRLGASLPAEHSAQGRSLEAEAVAAERSPDLTLAMPRAPEQPAVEPAPPGVASAAGQDGPPGPQRAPEGGERVLEMGPVTLLSEGDRTSRRAPKKEPPTEQELEVLAHQLYHRIGRHLRRELLVDRERVGFALDLP